MSQATYSSNSGGKNKVGRNTFGWRPAVDTASSAKKNESQRPVGLSTPISSPMSKDLSYKSPNTRQNLSIYGGSKRGTNSQNLSQNPTPTTKPLLHASKKNHADVSTPQRSGTGSVAANSRLMHSKSIQSPGTLKINGNGSATKQSDSASKVSIKKAASSPVFSRVLSKVELSKEFLDRLESNDLVELTIQPERAALSQCFTSLTELETLCEETAVMKVSHPTTKMKERINDLDQIVENARNVLLKVVAIYRECIEEAQQIERDYLQYTLCVKHNRVISHHNVENLTQENDNVIDTVAALNSTYLSLKADLAALTEETKELEVIQQTNEKAIQSQSEYLNNLNSAINTTRETIHHLREDVERLTEKVNELLREKTQREWIVRKKWESLIASLEQEEMIIERDRKMFLFNQQGEENANESRIKELKKEEGVEKEQEMKAMHVHQEVSEHVGQLNEKRTGLKDAIKEKEKEEMEKEFKIQQNENQKSCLLGLIQKKQETSEEELKELKHLIQEYNENYKQTLLITMQIENELKRLEMSIQEKQQQIQKLESEKNEVAETILEHQMKIASQKEEVNSKKKQLEQSKATLEKQNRHLVALNNDFKNQAELYSSNKKNLLNRLREQQYCYDHNEEIWEREKKEKRERIAFLKKEINRLEGANEQLEQDVHRLHQSSTEEEQHYLNTVHSLQQKKQQLQDLCQERENKRMQLEQNASVITELERRAAEGEMIRRRLHNAYQELRGNLRVIARVRPLLQMDRTCDPEPAVWCINDSEVHVRYKNKVQPFRFDGCFGFESTQTEVFEEVENFVQSALDGYNVCLFTYGQTGSGKTYTMQGRGEEEERGIIPRSIEKIIDEIERLKDIGWIYEIGLSYIEIYREQIRDLLVKNSGKLEIKLDMQGHPYIPNVTKLRVDSKRQIHSVMEIAASCRAVGSTDMNEHSSRSHVVFTLTLKGVNTRKNLSVEGRLNLVDLAGSERLDKSHSTGDALEEAKFINRSLSALSNVFINIRNNSSHINFRDSKLTLLLKDCLSKEGKTLMFVNLSPIAESAQESLCSLNFAATANQCKQGQAKRKLTRG